MIRSARNVLCVPHALCQRLLTPVTGWAIFLRMAAQPVLRKLCKQIEERGGDEHVFDMLRAGLSVRRIAETFDVPGHGSISRPLMYRWRDKSEERQAGWAAAMREGAHALAEDAGDVLEDLPEDPTSAQVAKAKGISEHKKWLAGLRDRDSYGAGPSTVVGVIGLPELHIEALRAAGNMDRQRLTAAPVVEADYEVEE